MFSCRHSLKISCKRISIFFVTHRINNKHSEIIFRLTLRTRMLVKSSRVTPTPDISFESSPVYSDEWCDDVT